MARISKPTSPAGAFIRDRKVLIVDDEIFIRNLVKRAVNAAGVLQTAEATDTETAARGLKTFDPDVLILDINMPGRSGLDLLRAIRSGKTQANRNLPVIILTSLGSDEFLSAALNLDASAFIAKGEGIRHLQDRIHRSLTERIQLRDPAAYLATTIPDQDKIAEAVNSGATKKPDGGTQPITTNSIKQGQPLSANLLTLSGQLLVTKGTIVSDTMLKRLKDIEETFGLCTAN